MEEITPKFKSNDIVKVNNEHYRGIYKIELFTIEDNTRVSYRSTDDGVQFWFGEEEVVELVGNDVDESVKI